MNVASILSPFEAQTRYPEAAKDALTDLKKSMQKDKMRAPKDAELADKWSPKSSQKEDTDPAKDVSEMELASEDLPSDPEMDSNIEEDEEKDEKEEEKDQEGDSSDGDLFKDAFEQQKKKMTQESQNRFDALPDQVRAAMTGFEEAVLATIPDDLSTYSDCIWLQLLAVAVSLLNPRADLKTFVELLIKEELFTMDNVEDVCSLEGQRLTSYTIPECGIHLKPCNETTHLR